VHSSEIATGQCRITKSASINTSDYPSTPRFADAKHIQDSRPARCLVTTLGKLFISIRFCHQTI